MKFSEFKHLSEQLWALENETPKNEVKISEIKQLLENISVGLFNYVNFTVLYRIDGKNFKCAVNDFLTSHNIGIYKLVEWQNFIGFYTDLYINDWRWAISIPLKNRYPFGANYVYGILKEYITDKSSYEANFLIDLKPYDAKLANELYEIIWDVIKAEYIKLKENKIKIEQQNINSANGQIELYSSLALIQKLIMLMENEKSSIEKNITKIKNELWNDVHLKTNPKHLEKAETSKEKITADIENLTKPEYIIKMIEQNQQSINKSSQIIKDLTEDDFELNLLKI